MLPHEYLGDDTKQRIDRETNQPNQVVVARLPTRADLPPSASKSRILFNRSSYDAILTQVDRYHAAAPAKQFGIADGIVGAVDSWLAAHTTPADDDKRARLIDLRSRAIQAGTSALADYDGDAQRASLTFRPAEHDDRPPGAFEFVKGVGEGLTGQGAAALDRLMKSVVQAAQAAPTLSMKDRRALPEAKASPLFGALQRSTDFIDLVAAVEQERALGLLATIIGFLGADKLNQRADVDPGLRKTNDALEQVLRNYEGVPLNPKDHEHPRKGKFQIEGGEAGMRATLQAGLGLDAEELDAIQGYTSLEYKAFNDGTVTPERRDALISAIAKLPKAGGPLYRGDYWATNTPGIARVGRTMKRDHFTSTSRSLEDSFISTTTTAHVYVSTRSAATIEGFSKKAWELEALFGPTAFRCVAVVDKTRKDDTVPPEARFKEDDKTLEGPHGLPTANDQASLGKRKVPLRLELGTEDGNADRGAHMKWYEKKLSDKVWVFWEEV